MSRTKTTSNSLTKSSTTAYPTTFISRKCRGFAKASDAGKASAKPSGSLGWGPRATCTSALQRGEQAAHWWSLELVLDRSLAELSDSVERLFSLALFSMFVQTLGDPFGVLFFHTRPADRASPRAGAHREDVAGGAHPPGGRGERSRSQLLLQVRRYRKSVCC